MAFCGNCGSQLQEGSAFCSSCGTAVRAAGAANAAPAQPRQPVSAAAPTASKGGKLSNPDLMLKIISVVLILTSFMPSFRLTGWSGISKSYSAMGNILVRDASAFPARVAVIIPFVLLLLLFFSGKLRLPAGLDRIAAAVLCALGMFFNFRYISVINSSLSSTAVKASLGFFVTMLLYLAGIIIALRGMKAQKR